MKLFSIIKEVFYEMLDLKRIMTTAVVFLKAGSLVFGWFLLPLWVLIFLPIPLHTDWDFVVALFFSIVWILFWVRVVIRYIEEDPEDIDVYTKDRRVSESD